MKQTLEETRPGDIDLKASNERPWSGIVDRVRSMEYGSTIPTGALYVAVGLPEVPTRPSGEGDRKYAQRVRRHSLVFASLLEKARRELLKVHKRDLRSSKPGEYTLVLPKEQAAVAQKDALHGARKALSAGSARSANVAGALLNDVQRRHASDVEAHLDSLRGMLRKK